MRVVLQRVREAEVKVDGRCVGAIGHGFLLLVGVTEGDDTATAEKLAEKVCQLRIFPDEHGKTNCSLAEVGGSLLVISQFTLYADCRKGKRPSFSRAAAGPKAEALYQHFVEHCRRFVPRVETGIFGADMKVSLLNDGPFTIILDSEEMWGR